MDKFLATHGAQVPVNASTNASMNAGVIVDIKESGGNYYINNLWTPFGRIAIANLAVPAVYAGKAATAADRSKQPTYGIRMLFNPAGCSDIEAGCIALAYAAAKSNPKWGPVTIGAVTFSIEQRLFDPAVPTALQIKVPLLDGNMKYGLDPVNGAMFQGTKYMNARMYPTTSKTSGVAQRPKIADRFGQPADPAIAYPGAYGTACISLGTYMQDNIPGIRAGFDAVKVVAEGDRIVVGYNSAAAAEAAIGGMAPSDFGSFVTEPSQQPPPGGVPQGYPPQGGYPIQNGAAPPAGGFAPPAGALPTQPAAVQPPGYGSAPPPAPVWNARTGQWDLPAQPPAPVWNAQTGQWDLPAQPAQQPPAPTWAPPGANGFAPPAGQAPQGAALPPGAYPPPR